MKSIALHCDGSLENIRLRVQLANGLKDKGLKAILLCDSEQACAIGQESGFKSYDLSQFDSVELTPELETRALDWMHQFQELDIHYLIHTHDKLNGNFRLNSYEHHYRLAISRILGVKHVHEQEQSLDYIWDFAGDELYHTTVRLLINACNAQLLAYRESVFPERGVLMSNQYLTFETPYSSIKDIEISSEEKEAMEDFFQTYFERKQIFWGNPKAKEKADRSKVTKRVFATRITDLFNKNRNFVAYNILKKYVRKRLNKRLYLRDLTLLENGKFIYFPLHYPVDSQLLLRGRPFTNQIALIELLIELLPYGYKLIVKEHPHARGLIRYRELKRIAKSDRVVLLNPTVNSHEIFDKIKATFIINSTVGVESLYRNIPVFNLGMNYLRGSGLTVDIESMFDFLSAFSSIDKLKVDHELLRKFFAYSHRYSYPISSIKTLQNKLSPQEIEDLSQILYNVIQTEKH